MAKADYRLCDVCDGKAFYDSNLNYEPVSDKYERTPFKYAGEDQYNNPELTAKYGMCLDYVGDWAVLCTDCAKTHRVQIVERNDGTSQA